MTQTLSADTRVPIRVPKTLIIWIIISALLVQASLLWIALKTPADVNLGIVQKIFYFHVGSAFAMMLGLTAASVMSLIDLIRPSDSADALARSFLEVGVVFAFCVLTSGPLWARKSWGMYWTWEPRLTLVLLVTLLAVAVLILRMLAKDSTIGRRVGAAMAVMGAPASYLIHFAVKWWGGNHPQVIQGGGIQNSEMRVAFWLAVVAILSSAAVLVATRYRAIRLQQRTQALALRLSARVLRRQRAPMETS
ncbi:MAG TPA: heme transporter [Myxococcales bacterium]|nr:heme transporter [Myxococcales bacterium]HAN31194.1 heme transporter [Myxococcales bacterium]